MNLYPIEAVRVRLETEVIPRGGTFHQQFLCEWCGVKQTMEEENRLFTRGKCEACGQETDIVRRGCNVLVYYTRGEGVLVLDDVVREIAEAAGQAPAPEEPNDK
jgi:hypothetical protein